MKNLFATLLVFIAVTTSPAAPVIFHYDQFFSDGAVSPGPYSPWVTATFDDVAPGVVSLTLSNSLAMPANHKVDELEFNLNPDFNPANLNFNLISSSGGFVLPAIAMKTDEFKADGDGWYDVKFAFQVGGMGTFTSGEFVTYEISGIVGLTALDFVHLSKPSGGAGPFFAAGHIQGLGPFGEDSAWIAATPSQTIIPEPGSISLFAMLGAFCLLIQTRRR